MLTSPRTFGAATDEHGTVAHDILVEEFVRIWNAFNDVDVALAFVKGV